MCFLLQASEFSLTSVKPIIQYVLSYFWRNPVYHQVVFACLLFLTGWRVTYLTRLSPVHSVRVPVATREDIFRLFWSGGGLFALGFLIWNVSLIRATE
jgi:dihydroceramidase